MQVEVQIMEEAVQAVLIAQQAIFAWYFNCQMAVAIKVISGLAHRGGGEGGAREG